MAALINFFAVIDELNLGLQRFLERVNLLT